MKRYLLTVFALGLAMQAQAQLLYVGNTGLVHVEDQALVYSGGGVKVDGGGKIDNIGDIMINGTSSDKLETVGTGTFTMKRTSATVYGQLSVDGLTQTNITNTAGNNQGIVIKEMRYDVDHGDFQQVAIPYKGKVLSTLGTEASNTVSGARYTGNMMVWNPTTRAFDHKPDTFATANSTAYYILNKKNPAVWAVTSATKNLTGEPYTDTDAGLSQVLTTVSTTSVAAFGAGGNNRNSYNERYKTYIEDPFRATAWSTDYGINLFQFGNPFLCNIDLSNIGIAEASTPNDGNFINNIVGIRTSPAGVVFTLNGNVGTTNSSNGTVVLFTSGAPASGDKDKCVVKPFETFFIKLDPTLGQTGGDSNLNFKTLRRFAQTARAGATAYSVNAARGSKAAKSSSSDVVRQLGVFAYDTNNEKLENTYFTVSNLSTTGYNAINNMQAPNTVTEPILFTQEETSIGGADVQNSSEKLYINTANEVDFLGKALPMTVDNTKATTLKFKLYENLQDVEALTSGESYYIQDNSTGELTQIDNNTVVSVKNKNYSLYYGKPSSALATSEVSLDNNTHVFKTSGQYAVRFNKQKALANVEIFNLAGQLISSDAKVETSSDLKLNLEENANATYIVKITYNDATVVTKKIVK